MRYDRDQPKVESERRDRKSRAGAKGERKPSAQGRRLSNSKREERERRQKVIRVKQAGVAALALLAVVGVIWGLVAIYTSPIFRIERVVVTGNDHLTQESVVSSAAVPADATLVRVPISAIEKRLKANPWVKSAKVSKDYPNALNIEIVEREPALAVDAGGKNIWVVSKDGFWLGLRSAEDTGLVSVIDVPKIEPRAGRAVRTPELKNAVDVFWGISAELRAMVRVVSASSVGKTALHTRDDVEVFIGEATDLKAKDRIAREILAREAGKVVYINVRVVDKPTWRGLNQQP